MRTLTVALLFMFTISWSATIVGAQDKPQKEPPAPKDATKESSEEENPLPSYELAEDATLEEAIAFVKQLEAYRPKDRASALSHSRKGRAAIGPAFERIVKLSEQQGKTDDSVYLSAKRSTLQADMSKKSTVDAEAAREALADIVTFVSTREELETEDSRLAVYSGYYFLRANDDSDAAQKLLAKLSTALRRSSNEAILEDADRVDGFARRAVLIGNPVEVTGTKLDGTPFNLESLQGKVVLVDFWATWCGPCLREHPNIEKNYEKYHDQGFEVVGISLDKDRGQLEAHVKKNDTPWIILHDNDGKSPAARRYGVFGIPSMFLIDADGKVISTTARGAKLSETLATLFPSKDDDASKDTAEEKPEGKKEE